MEIDYPVKDFGFSTEPKAELTECLIEGGQLHKQIMRIDALEERDLEGGFYKRDPAVTYVPKTGGRFALYRWKLNGSP